MLPRKLQNMNMFHEGASFLGEVASVTLPKLSRTTQDYRGGGMPGSVELATGLDKLALEWAIGGYTPEVIRQFGVTDVAGTLLRFVGAYQRHDTGTYDAVEVVMRGFHKEIDRGDAKPGEDTETKITSSLSYYKEILNGEVLCEIDMLNCIAIFNGVDTLAAERAAMNI